MASSYLKSDAFAVDNIDESASLTKIFTLRNVRSVLVIVSVVVAIVFGLYFINFNGPLSALSDHWGQFGDYVGGLLNPILAFLGFGALLLSLVLQSKELHESTQQLKLSAKALDDQYKVLMRQSFENTYFQLLRRVGEIVAATISINNATGLRAFDTLYGQLVSNLRQQNVSVVRTKEVYRNFYRGERHILGHYFRTLYHVFTFVDNSNFNQNDKIAYANIARAQLSTIELNILFYNGITGEGEIGFKPLIERYGILKHVVERDLVLPPGLGPADFYEPTAFMSADDRANYYLSRGQG